MDNPTPAYMTEERFEQLLTAHENRLRGDVTKQITSLEQKLVATMQGMIEDEQQTREQSLANINRDFMYALNQVGYKVDSLLVEFEKLSQVTAMVNQITGQLAHWGEGLAEIRNRQRRSEDRQEKQDQITGRVVTQLRLINDRQRSLNATIFGDRRSPDGPESLYSQIRKLVEASQTTTEWINREEERRQAELARRKQRRERLLALLRFGLGNPVVARSALGVIAALSGALAGIVLYFISMFIGG